MAIAPLLSAQELSKTYGLIPLFERITLAVSEQERICLIGPNGSGKSTLLRIFAGLEAPDSGSVSLRRGLRSAYVAQDDSFDENLTISRTLELALVAAGHDEHDVDGKIAITCGRFGFPDRDAAVLSLSGGWRKRLALARGMIVDPELLLLDEPTNHLDIEGVLWLESVLAAAPFAFLFVSHDRHFIEHLAGRVFEIDRQYPRGFFSASGAYGDFLEARSAYLTGLHQNKVALENKVRREVAWLRQGAKARTTKAKYRVAAAGELVEELKSFRLDDNRVALGFSSSQRKTRQLVKLEHVSKGFAGRKLFENISLTISPGDRLGIVGPNGSGKSTFVKVLLGEIMPDSGRVHRAPNIRSAFFDQGRRQLDPGVTLHTALCAHGDSVVYKGRPVHVVGWAARFLFSREQLALPVKSLSGGEQARLLLAKLMLEESDILLFDEPTNDLDIKTLEVLEESFSEYPGAIVLITHDRYVLDRTATTVLGLGHGRSGIYGDYLQWEAFEASLKAEPSARREIRPTVAERKQESEPTRLTFTEQRELRGIEQDILKAEALLNLLQLETSAEGMVYDPQRSIDSCRKLAEQQTIVDSLYSRWEALEQKRKEVEERAGAKR